jgi:hypothetical protein
MAMRRDGCWRTGNCEPCDGYGDWEDPDSGAIGECEICEGDGVCTECDGTGENAEQDEITEMEVGE